MAQVEAVLLPSNTMRTAAQQKVQCTDMVYRSHALAGTSSNPLPSLTKKQSLRDRIPDHRGSVEDIIDNGDPAMYARICVRKPYFALRHLCETRPGEVTCAVPMELEPGRQAPITLGEAARHSAILGLCAVASTALDDQRRYYLAHTGTITRLTSRTIRDSSLSGKATGRFDSERSASATSVITTSEGEPLFRLELAYSVLTTRVFHKVFGYAHADSGATDANPYVHPLRLAGLTCDSQQATATVSAAVDECAGHFPGFPTLPLAVLINGALDLGAHLITKLEPGAERIPVHLDLLQVKRLVPAGQQVQLRAVPEKSASGEHAVALQAIHGDSEVATMTARYAPPHDEDRT